MPTDGNPRATVDVAYVPEFGWTPKQATTATIYQYHQGVKLETQYAMSQERVVESTAAHHAGGYLSFALGDEEYGIDIMKVQEIRGYEVATRMVNAPGHVLGVLNLRGVIVPIFDLRIKFGLPEAAYRNQTVTIVLNIGERVVGMVVDAVSDVMTLNIEDINPAPDLYGDAVGKHVIGFTTIEQAEKKRTLILLDIEQLITSPELALVTPTLQ